MPYTRHNAAANSANGSSDNLDEGMWKLKVTDDKHEGDDGQQSQYPDRPGKPDCISYLKTGACDYGIKCKYNHPATVNGQAEHARGTMYREELPQRDGQPDCQFFLKTGSCKFGPACKYHHPREKHDGQPIQFNALGLPLRKDEKSCTYYMRTASCKFGVACKFNHPEPSTFGAMLPTTETSVHGEYTNSWAAPLEPPVIPGLSPWTLSRNPPRVQGHPVYMPVVLPPNAMQQGWSTYMPGSSTPFYLPDKPQQPECQYYLRTGNCKYGSSCKYSHLPERMQADACTIGPLGLPLRPGFPVCGSYTAYGSCKFGTICKFDHPIMGYYNYPPVFAIQEPPVLLANQRGLLSPVAENSTPKTSKTVDKLVNTEEIAELNYTDNSVHGEPSTITSPSHRAALSDSAQNQSD